MTTRQRYVRGHAVRARRNGEEEIPVTQRRCVICGETHRHCDCRCTWCGAKLWTFHSSHGRWIHHICGNRKVKGAR